MNKPTKLYNATISYRTPSGRRVLYGTVVAARNSTQCEGRLRERLESEARFGRRRIGAMLNDFQAIPFSTQIIRRRQKRLSTTTRN